MPKSLQGGSLAGSHEGKPGLPRGRSRLPARAVRASQVERLCRAVIAAVAEAGYANVTVADIVRRAKVSRVAFYTHFRTKEDCFLAATREGGQLMADRVTTATRALPAGTADEEVLRAGIRAFLGFLADEPAFARVFYVDMATAGPRAVGRFEAAERRFAEMTATWHRRARARHPDWPAIPDDAYLAVEGATARLVRAAVRNGETHALPKLEDTIVALHLAVFAARPWPALTAETGPAGNRVQISADVSCLGSYGHSSVPAHQRGWRNGSVSPQVPTSGPPGCGSSRMLRGGASGNPRRLPSAQYHPADPNANGRGVPVPVGQHDAPDRG